MIERPVRNLTTGRSYSILAGRHPEDRTGSSLAGDNIESPDGSSAVSVLVVAFNSGEHLQRCLGALEQQTFTDFEVILVDNGSDDGSIEALTTPGLRMTLIRAGQNLGFAAANNLAANKASGRWLATLNPDAFAEPDWLEQLMSAVERNPGIVMFGSTQRDAADPSVLDGAGDPYHAFGFAWRGGKGARAADKLPGEGEVFGPCAAAALYRRDLFLALGGFDERFFCYYEDVDLAFRMRLRGCACMQVPTATVAHIGSAVSGAYSPFSVYHITRNRVWTFLKNMPTPLHWLLALPAATVLLQSLARKPRKAKWRGIRDAVRDYKAVLTDRRHVQTQRTVSSLRLAKAMSWSLSRARARDPDIRPLPTTLAIDTQPQAVCGVVVIYNSDGTLGETLPPLLAQVQHVVVIDNGSDSATRQALESIAADYPDKLHLIFNESNLGLACAQNQGVAYALDRDFPWVLLMDQDSIVQPGMVAKLLSTYADEPRDRPFGLLAPRIDRRGMSGEQPMNVSRHPFHFKRCRFNGCPVIHDLLFAIASGSLIPAPVLKDLGAMRDDFFIDYVDVDFCLRLRRAGYDILAVRDAVITHNIGATAEQQLFNKEVAVTHHLPSRRYYIYRNRIRLWRTYAWRLPAWVGFEFLAVLHDLVKILRFEKQRREKLKNIIRGAWDGVRGVGGML